MSQLYVFPPGFATSTNPSVGPNNTPIPLDSTLIGAEFGGNLLPLQADASGDLKVNVGSSVLPTGAATEATLSAFSAKTAAGLVDVRFDEVALTYVTVGNGIGQIETAVYKLASVTVKTLTLSYDSSDRLSGVVAS